MPDSLVPPEAAMRFDSWRYAFKPYIVIPDGDGFLIGTAYGSNRQFVARLSDADALLTYFRDPIRRSAATAPEARPLPPDLDLDFDFDLDLTKNDALAALKAEIEI